jgi:hypothetical protein
MSVAACEREANAHRAIEITIIFFFIVIFQERCLAG